MILLAISTGVALSMDCLAVSSCYGLSSPKNRRLMLELGLYFGLFQMVMILIGNLMGGIIVNLIYGYTKVFAASLLVAISVKMIIEGIRGEEVCFETDRIRIIYLAFATSIDALLVGLAFTVFNEAILLTSIIVGGVCFIMTVGGFVLGELLHRFIGRFAQFFGAAILILIAIKALLKE